MADEQKYEVLSAQDRLAIARDFLRGREEEHYRLYLASPDPSNDDRIAAVAEQVTRLQAEVAARTAEAA